MKNKSLNILKQIPGYFTGELKSILHDPGAVLIFLIAMVIYPVLYSLGYKNETITDIPVAVADLDHSQLSRQFSRMADATSQLHVVDKSGSLKEAEELFWKGTVNGIILIPEGFEKNIEKGLKSDVAVYCDAGYFLLYKQVYAGAVYSAATLGAGVEISRSLAGGIPFQQALAVQNPLKTETYNLYNPSGGYGTFVMPGIILIVMQQTLLIGIGLLGGTIRRRDRYKHLARQISGRGGAMAAIFGKSSAYVLIYLVNSLFAVGLLHHWLNFPDKSGFFPVLWLLVPYFYTISFLGLALSVFFRERSHSLMFMVFLSPVVLFLSGLSWPASAIPRPLYWLAHIFPSTTMVPAYIRLRILGAGLQDIRADYIFLLVQMIVYFVIASLVYRYMTKRISNRPALEFS